MLYRSILSLLVIRVDCPGLPLRPCGGDPLGRCNILPGRPRDRKVHTQSIQRSCLPVNLEILDLTVKPLPETPHRPASEPAASESKARLRQAPFRRTFSCVQGGCLLRGQLNRDLGRRKQRIVNQAMMH